MIKRFFADLSFENRASLRRLLIGAFLVFGLFFAFSLVPDVNQKQLRSSLAGDVSPTFFDTHRTVGGDLQSAVEPALDGEVVMALAVHSIVDDRAAADPEVASLMHVNGSSVQEVSEDAREMPAVSAKAILVRNMNANMSVLNQAPSARWPLASLTKLMTAIVAAEELELGTVVKITEEAVATEGVAGGLLAGEEYSVEDLIKAMMVVSSNDAATALQIAYDEKQARTLDGQLSPKTTSAFLEAMNRKAAALGMAETSFSDPSGLSSLSQGTLGDLEKMVRYIQLNHPDFFEYSNKREATIVEQITGRKSIFTNINLFARTRVDFVGGKTGYTPEAGENLLSIFDEDGEIWLVILLGSEDRFTETLGLLRWALANN